MSFAPAKRLVMIRCIDYVAVHSIPEDGTPASMHLRFNTSSPIISHGISQDGKWCALSTAGTSKIFALVSFVMSNTKLQLIRGTIYILSKVCMIIRSR